MHFDQTLIAVSHGTSSASGQAVVEQLASRVAERLRDEADAAGRPCPAVRLAHVDVQRPQVPEVLAALPEGTEGRIVPLLLSAGYHVNTDLAEAVSGSAHDVTIAPALGPDDRLVDLLRLRLS